jgi:hypothetical protein
MGRSFESVRMGAKEVSERWLKASRALKKDFHRNSRFHTSCAGDWPWPANKWP